MIKALLLEKDDAGFAPASSRSTKPVCPRATCGSASSTRPELQGRPRDHRQGRRSCAAGRWSPASTARAPCCESSHPDWKPGDRVVLNGWGVGETHWGCLAQQARLPGRLAGAAARGLLARQAMAIGTAGYTAMLCVLALERHGVTPGGGEVLVTGATGGVGSVAVALLSRLGHHGRRRDRQGRRGRLPEAARRRDVIDRAELVGARQAAAEGALGRRRRCGRQPHARQRAARRRATAASVAACGLAQGIDLPATVMPFILRGVTLAGVDSVMAPIARRRESLGAAGARPRSGGARGDDDRSAAGRCRRAGPRADGWAGSRPDRRDDLTIGRPAAWRVALTGCSAYQLQGRAEGGVATGLEPFEQHHFRRHDVGAECPCPCGRGIAVEGAPRTDRIADPLDRAADLEQARDRLHHADVRSQPATINVSRPRGSRSTKPASATAEKANLRSVVSQSARTSGTFGPRPSGFSSVPITGMRDSRAALAELRCSAGRPRRRHRSPASGAPAGR